MKLNKVIILLSVLAIGLNIYFFLGTGFIVTLSALGLLINVISLIVLIVIGLVRFVKKRDNSLIVSILIGVSSLVFIFFVPVGELIEKQKSSVVFKGYCEHTVTSTSLTLRKDNSFEFNSGAFLSREIYYGTYILNNDTIELSFAESKPKNLKTKLYLGKEGVYELGRKSFEWKEYFKSVQNELQ